MFCKARIQALAFTVFIIAPFFIFAQTPSIADLKYELAEENAAYAALIERLEKAEARAIATENARLQAEAASRPSGLVKHVSRNFEVTAPTRAIGEKVCAAAEAEWAKGGLPNLYKPCQIRVKVGQIGAGGATTFSFGGGEVFGFDMTVQGSLDKILRSVIPHEVCHMKNACNERRPLYRWGDEGSATLHEDDEDRAVQIKRAREDIGTNRFIPIRDLLTMTEYPSNMSYVLSLYAEGAALSEFLIGRASRIAGEEWTREEGRKWMMGFLRDAREKGFDAALYDRRNIKGKSLGNISNVAELSNTFTAWLKSGNAQIYAFKEVPLTTEQNVILPVNYFDINKNRMAPAN